MAKRAVCFSLDDDVSAFVAAHGGRGGEINFSEWINAAIRKNLMTDFGERKTIEAWEKIRAEACVSSNPMRYLTRHIGKLRRMGMTAEEAYRRIYPCVVEVVA